MGIILLLSSCSTIAPVAKDAIVEGAKSRLELRSKVSKGDVGGESSVAQSASTAVLEDTKGTYEGPVRTVVVGGEIPIQLLIVLILLGWAIPSPSEMGRGCLNAVRVLKSSNQQ